MKRKLASLWLATAMVGLLVVGCNKNTSGPDEDTPPVGVTDEQSAMKVAAENDEFVKNDELTIADQAVVATDYAYLSGFITADITPLRWGRFVTNVRRTVTVNIQPGDTLAVANVQKNISGTLKIKALRGLDTVLIEKPFNDTAERNVLFKRIGRGPRFWQNWIPVATSLVAGGTVNGQIAITQISMISSRDSLTINNPLRFFLRYRWLRHMNGDRDMLDVNASDSVTVRVTLESASPDTDLVALRFGANSAFRYRAGMRLVRQVAGGTLGYIKTYERKFYVHNRPGHYHAAVDVMTRATLYDDSPSSYSVSWWGVPYRVF